jgi:hypothetical protein
MRENKNALHFNFFGRTFGFHGIIVVSLTFAAYHWGTSNVFYQTVVVEKLNFKRMLCKMRLRIFMS